MGKPRMIILIRHAQSEGNKNRDIHQTIPDHRVKLTQEGWTQAHDAGRRLRSLLKPSDTLHFFTSPYRRTRETTEGILKTLTSDEPSPSPFPRHSIKVYEEPRLREQDFGNFQPCSAEMERMWQERADYGHFFYRIPNGESAADAYDRVSGFNESLWRQFGEEDCASVCVLVTHGLMSRVFLMKWYHFSVEYFEDLRNVNHCEFLIMRKKEDSGKYILENNLRTWSDLKRERLAAQAAKEKSLAASNLTNPASPSTSSATLGGSDKDREKERKLLGNGDGNTITTIGSPIPPRKKWGGCPNGCDHGKHYYKKENSMHAMQLNGKPLSTTSSPITGPGEFSSVPQQSLQFRRPAARRWQSSSEEDEDDPRGKPSTGPVSLDVNRENEELVSSPDGTPSFISVEDRLRGHLKSPAGQILAEEGLLGISGNGNGRKGRDFSGSLSGGELSGTDLASLEGGSDTEFSAEEDTRKRLAKGKSTTGIGRKLVGSGLKGRVEKEKEREVEAAAELERKLEAAELKGGHRGALADALGDQSDVGSDAGSVADLEGYIGVDLENLEREDKSVKGSVY